MPGLQGKRSYTDEELRTWLHWEEEPILTIALMVGMGSRKVFCNDLCLIVVKLAMRFLVLMPGS